MRFFQVGRVKIDTKIPFISLLFTEFRFGCVGSLLLPVDFPQLWRAEAAPRCGAQALTAVAPLLAEHRL